MSCSASSLPTVAPIHRQSNISFQHARLDRRRFFIKLQGLAKPDLSRIMRAPDQGASLLPESNQAFFCFTLCERAARKPQNSAVRNKIATFAPSPRDCCAEQHNTISPDRLCLTLCRPYCAPKIDGQCSWQTEWDQLSDTTLEYERPDDDYTRERRQGSRVHCR